MCAASAAEYVNMQGSYLVAAISQQLFADAERQTYNSLQYSITQLKAEHNAKKNELIGYYRRIIALVEHLNQTNKLIDLQKQQLDAEFEIRLGHLKEQAISELGQVKASLSQQMTQLADE